MRCESLQNVLSSLNLAVSLDDLMEAHGKSASLMQAAWGRNEQCSTADQVRLIMQMASGGKLDLPRDPRVVELLEKAYVDPLFAFPPTLNEDVISTLAAVRESVRKIGLISNTGRSPGLALRRVLHELGILSFFDVTVFSDEAGCRKPDIRIFRLATKELDTDPSTVIHVGDNPEADVWGAKQAGMRAVLFDYPVLEEFKSEPRSLFALSRADRHVSDSEIKPDFRITSLREVLGFIDSLA